MEGEYPLPLSDISGKVLQITKILYPLGVKSIDFSSKADTGLSTSPAFISSELREII